MLYRARGAALAGSSCTILVPPTSPPTPDPTHSGETPRLEPRAPRPRTPGYRIRGVCASDWPAPDGGWLATRSQGQTERLLTSGARLDKAFALLTGLRLIGDGWPTRSRPAVQGYGYGRGSRREVETHQQELRRHDRRAVLCLSHYCVSTLRSSRSTIQGLAPH
jgi:hypothetical protein